ncbi:MAG TPA: GNAT family N-acetyltransferase [Actinomycetota bacterium]|jgi:GNAT superfamily N-acetyltransferase|nr:GNAT family N-acetyltransferase [Actinomycetota bacterium]
MPIEIRPFKRTDRDHVTALVNAHIGAVVPGLSVSVNAVMSQMERDPAEVVVDPWVVERRSLVAVEREAVVAAAHLLRYGADERVGDSYRNAGEIKWLVARPSCADAADLLLTHCLKLMDSWDVERQYADGALPSPVTYGVCDAWSHIRSAYERAGFVDTRVVEILLVADAADLPSRTEPPLDKMAVGRSLADGGTRFSAILDGETVATIDVQTNMTRGGARSHLEGWGEIGAIHTIDTFRRRGVGRWLVSIAADWLRLGRVERILAYAYPEPDDEALFLRAVGFKEVARMHRGWQRER